MEILYKNKKGHIIKDLDSWEKAFLAVDEPKHWKEGRSAFSLAKYICERDGESEIRKLLLDAGIPNPKLIEAEIEHESKFDRNGGRGRMQDLHMVYDSTKGPIVVEIEAKVDESFNSSIDEAYSMAVQYTKDHPTSKRTHRIKELVKKIYGLECLDEVKDLRYQLLYYLAGTYSEAKMKNAKIAFMPVLVFHTEGYNETIGGWNRQDYLEFIEKTGFKTVLKNGQTLFTKEFDEGFEIISTYKEISLLK